jgi:hypothetical protein
VVLDLAENAIICQVFGLSALFIPRIAPFSRILPARHSPWKPVPTSRMAGVLRAYLDDPLGLGRVIRTVFSAVLFSPPVPPDADT